MIISKTPVRISFLGGGTDYPEYFERHPGAVLGTAINRHVYLNIKETHQFFDYKYRISYKKAEVVDTVEEIQHPSVRACLKYLDIKEHMEIYYQGDWPARTGLGSSSSFTVGLLNSLYAFKNKFISKEQLAKKAIHVERNIIGERVGWQDQIWASFGGLAKIEMNDNNFEYQPIMISEERKREFHSYMMLFFTGIKRYSQNILDEQIKKTNTKSNDEYLEEMYQLVQEGTKVLYEGKLEDFGRILHKNWELKKKLSSKITNPQIDEIYSTALKNGALGGKLLGAGGGGFLLIFAKPENHKKIQSALKSYQEVDFEFQERGSNILYFG